MKKLFFACLTLSFAVMLTTSAFAAYLNPALVQTFEQNPDQVYYPAVVVLAEQAPIDEITADLEASNASFQERHSTVLLALQEVAGRTQPEFNAFLEFAMTNGDVEYFQAIWLINAFRVDATESFLRSLIARDDIGEVVLNLEIEPIRPVEVKESANEIAGVETGLQVINAPAAWARGFTGAGRLVAHLDSGVNGNHPALSARWRGLDPAYAGHPEWAFWEQYGATFPYDSETHGTHTMGTICGADHNSGDTIGVAIDAEWINALLYWDGSIPNYMSDAFTAFQWIADPDGNPGTTFDVPDVCSNSWGISPIYHGVPDCDTYFWNVLDNCEAAGVAVVFAAGNEGSSPTTLRTPADRATTDYNCFAVGAVDGNQGGYPIASFSSRGPVYCTPGGNSAIKPEVSAPGVNVRSALSYGGYTTMSGTSMACPHVAGSIALLRQASPGATVTEVKNALMMTATDLGSFGEDNTYGWGLINVDAAIDYLGSVAIDMIPHNDPVIVNPGGSFLYDGILINGTAQVQNVDVWILLNVPGFGVYGPVMQFNNVVLQPNQTLIAPGVQQDIPGYAPLGLYSYVGHVGNYPTSASQTSFPFTVVAKAGGGHTDSWAVDSWFGGEAESMPSKTAFLGNNPNPFNARTDIHFDLPSAGQTTLEVYNIMGQKVASLVNNHMEAGSHSVSWDAGSFSSGVYFTRLTTNGTTVTTKMNLLK